MRPCGVWVLEEQVDKWVSKCALLILLVENTDGRAIPLLEMTRQ
jgi:hypothetical protein